jgi:signal transduction histidine kinase
MGLGLAIARGIVEGHGGRIWAEQRSARNGARFVFILPSALADKSSTPEKVETR